MAIYFPYLRGKQYELMVVRECAKLLANSDFIPIIEPVRSATSPLKRALEAVVEADGKAIVIVNPEYGDHGEDPTAIQEFLVSNFGEDSGITSGLLLREDDTAEEAAEMLASFGVKLDTIVHSGFRGARELIDLVGDDLLSYRHVFIEGYCGKLYRRHFKGAERILIRDGFQRRDRNSDHPNIEPFSDLHATYEDEEGAQGFGDFLIVGDNFSESGGPAYTVAIHLTYIDDERDDEMFVHHFKSDTGDTPTDPAGKFGEALVKLVREVKKPKSKILKTSAVQEFLELKDIEHFPGLGYVKKLSMKHHIETLALYFEA